MQTFVESALRDAQQSLAGLLENQGRLAAITAAGEHVSQALSDGRRVYSCGNGGSMCDAMHFAEELSGKFRKPRAALSAMAISDPAHLSCAANDFGYDSVFSRFVEAHGSEGDILLAISTSGESPNILKATESALDRKMKVVALTGKDDCSLGRQASIHISTPGVGGYSDRVQELHIKVIHILIEMVERSLFPENYQV